MTVIEKFNLTHADTIWLQGVGEVFGKPVENLVAGDKMFWNFGSTSILNAIEKTSAKMYTLTEAWKDTQGKEHIETRKCKIGRVIATAFEGQLLGTNRNKAAHDLKLPLNPNDMSKTFAKDARAMLSNILGKDVRIIIANDDVNLTVVANGLRRVKNDKGLQGQFDNLEDFKNAFNKEFLSELTLVKSKLAVDAPAKKETLAAPAKKEEPAKAKAAPAVKTSARAKPKKEEPLSPLDKLNAQLKDVRTKRDFLALNTSVKKAGFKYVNKRTKEVQNFSEHYFSEKRQADGAKFKTVDAGEVRKVLYKVFGRFVTLAK